MTKIQNTYESVVEDGYLLHINDASKTIFLGLDLDGIIKTYDPINPWFYYDHIGIQDGATVLNHIKKLAHITPLSHQDNRKTQIEKLIPALKYYVCDGIIRHYHFQLGRHVIDNTMFDKLKYYESALNNTDTCISIKAKASTWVDKTKITVDTKIQFDKLLKSDVLSDCLTIYIEILSIIESYLQTLPNVQDELATVGKEIDKFDLIRYLNLETLQEKASTAALTVDVDSDKDVEADIEKLLTHPQHPITGFVFSTRSINLLNGGKFTDIFSGNNKYFKIDFEDRTLVPRAERYQGRTKGHFAHLLSAILQTGRVAMKTLKYPPELPVSTGGKMVTSLIADLNQQFEYVDPRLNTLNTTSAMSLFSSNKANAINAAMKATEDLHAAEYSEYKTTAESKRILEEIKKLEETIDDKRKDNREKPNFRTAQNLEKAKAAYRKRIDELIEASLYKEERRFLVRAKDRVLSKRDLVKRFTQNLFRRGERGGRTLKRR